MKKVLTTASAIATLSASVAVAATTPYDLIRPTWPLTWDDKVIDKFDTTVTKKIGVLDIPRTPAEFKAGALIPDTLDQAYLDAINTKISPIRVNQAGYLKKDTERQFYFVGSAEEFEVVDEMGKPLSPKVTGTFKNSEEETSSDWTIIAGTNTTRNDQMRYQIDFTGTTGNIQIGNIPQSVPTEKRLRIKVGSEISSTFIVSEDVYTMVKDASLKFFGIQRSGNSQSWFHGPSHTKDGSGKVVKTEGYKSTVVEDISFEAGDLQGGWYDCGDHLKESQTQAFAFMTLAVMSATNPAKDVDHYAYNQGDFVKTDDVPDVLREAAHGAAFFVNSYRAAKGVIDNMVVSVGNFGSDHGWWGRPEVQDALTVEHRGGPTERDLRLGEIGSNVGGEIAAGLAIVGKLYAKYDKDFADSCLTVAEKMYDFAKSLALGKDTYDNGKKFVYNKVAAGWGSPAYIGNNEYFDDMALASVALLYATGKKEYLNDALFNEEINKGDYEGAGYFEGGWFADERGAFFKNGKNTSWSNSYTYALYALYKLILADSKTAQSYGLTEEQRLAAIEDCVADMVANLGDVSGSGIGSITLPKSDIGWKSNTVSYDPTWYSMLTDQTWIYNRWQAGNILEVLAYADVAADIEKQNLKLATLGSNLKSSEMFQLGINQLNYLLGVNPWDISFVYGVGDKNDNHPHHRASNPEGKNAPAWNYKYVRPVGALFGGVTPNSKNSMVPSSMSWEDYHISETCLDASAVLTSALTIVSNGGNDYYEKKCDNCKTTDATPFSEDNVYATAYRYKFGSLDYVHLEIVNGTTIQQDSVVTYIYYEATEDDVKKCAATVDSDICQAYDEAGFNKPCNDDTALRNQLRIGSYNPKKIDGTYNDETKTYTWALPIVLGSIKAGNRIRHDLAVSKGLIHEYSCETIRQTSIVKLENAWSFASHTATKDAPVYAGAPIWDKDQGDYQDPPADPYIVIRSKGKLLWGYGPANETADRVIETPIDSTEAIKVAAPAASAKMFVTGQSLLVQASAQGIKTLKIFDLLGNQLMSRSFEGTHGEVRFEELSRRGTLIAKLVSGNKILASKAFKVK